MENQASYEGRVKWFSNKSGYGFITVTKNNGVDEVNLVDEDIFIHHTGITTLKSVYKYLSQGESVKLLIDKLKDSEKHKYQAHSVRPLTGIELVCEIESTRPRFRSSGKGGRGRGKGRGFGRGRGGGRGMDTQSMSQPIKTDTGNYELNDNLDFPALPEKPVVEEEVVEEEVVEEAVVEEEVVEEKVVEEEGVEIAGDTSELETEMTA